MPAAAAILAAAMPLKPGIEPKTDILFGDIWFDIIVIAYYLGQGHFEFFFELIKVFFKFDQMFCDILEQLIEISKA